MPTAHMSTDGCEALSARSDFRIDIFDEYSRFQTYDTVHMPTAHMSTDGCEALSATHTQTHTLLLLPSSHRTVTVREPPSLGACTEGSSLGGPRLPLWAALKSGGPSKC